MFENPRRGRQARNFTTHVPKILDLKSSSEQIFSENWRWVLLLSTLGSRGFFFLSIMKPRFIRTTNWYELKKCKLTVEAKSSGKTPGYCQQESRNFANIFLLKSWIEALGATRPHTVDLLAAFVNFYRILIPEWSFVFCVLHRHAY